MRHEGRLRRRILQSHQRRLSPDLRPRGSQIFLKTHLVRRDRRVGELENLRHAAVVRLDRVHLGARISLGKIQNVIHVCAAPRVDRLRIVPNCHQAVVRACKQIDQGTLHRVRILILVHQNMSEPLLIDRQHLRTLLEKIHRQAQHVIEIERVRIALFLHIRHPHLFQLRRPILKIGIPHPQDLPQPHACVHYQAEHRDQHVGLGKPPLLRIDVQSRHHRVHQRFLVIAVQNRKGFRKADLLRVTAQDAIADRVERARPQIAYIPRHQRFHPFHHFPRRLVGESQQQDATRLLPLIE